MADNENTARRGIYLPKGLDNFFVEEAKKTGRRINSVMIEALKIYKDEQENKVKDAEKELEQKIDKMVKDRLKKAKNI